LCPQILRTFSLKTRLLINDIAFYVGSIAADNRDNERFWEPLSDYIGDNLHVTEVTIRLPHDMNHEIDESKESKGIFDQEWYFWPAVDQLAMLLMGGKIQKLRLAYGATYLVREHSEEDSEEAESGEGNQSGEYDPWNGDEEFAAIERLRYPMPENEHIRELQEMRASYEGLDEGEPQLYEPWGALVRKHKQRRYRRKFILGREDNPAGDVGTVLVLTWPAII